MSAKSRELLPLLCAICNTIFYRTKHQIQMALNENHHTTQDCCSLKCLGIFNSTKIETICNQCNLPIIKTKAQLRQSKSGRSFCSKSCAAKYNNAHKSTGTRRSKLEIQIEQQLIQLYPNLEIHFNRKDAIDSELDIYIPLFRLAFELNGIFHYEPIYGQNKLNSIQNNDQNKFMKCQEKQISLCIIDTSQQKYFKESTSIKYLNIIIDIINQHLACI